MATLIHRQGGKMTERFEKLPKLCRTRLEFKNKDR